ncbi:phenol hydroxylase subunit P4 [Novosphingobium sp. Fuku2-ISO-50]|jgi:phenol hydroxylase P4 protein|uniref:phenol hydroxylase subunit P4 n=1 Tax=Novosphingobium sp. Fuku2-ISO-50 TaxID=1739114 RepID=UPI00076C37F8|nr:phenol hydroxylase subunit P4 [Novosphingobium sp. Fuku2-ISO-50]KUR76769.1 phenol hydroxylase [Novosphingobium sp. Fuku2-ISO-50]
MPVKAIKDYPLRVADSVDKFHGNIMLFVGWDQHLMFCAPFAWALPPAMRFGDLIEGIFPASFGAHPDFALIDWSKVEWLKSGKPWAPDVNKSLAENGLGHKDCLRFRTPGLCGIKGSGS